MFFITYSTARVWGSCAWPSRQPGRSYRSPSSAGYKTAASSAGCLSLLASETYRPGSTWSSMYCCVIRPARCRRPVCPSSRGSRNFGKICIQVSCESNSYADAPLTGVFGRDDLRYRPRSIIRATSRGTTMINQSKYVIGQTPPMMTRINASEA